MTRQTCFNSIGEGCGRVLPLADFFTQGKRGDGSPRYTALCKECSRTKTREWRHAHPERVTAYNKRDWRVHREARTARNVAYNAEHREARRERERERRRRRTLPS